MLYVALAVGVIVVLGFLRWRITSVARGARQRDERLLKDLDPIAERLTRKEPVAAEEILGLAGRPQYRPMLYQLLKHFERPELFPVECLSVRAQGEGVLAYWLMHPNELQDPPAEMEFVEEIEHEIDGDPARFLVFRYRMPAGHWAEKNGWILGLAGPFRRDDEPYSGMAAGFSRCGDKFGEVSPTELIDWYVGMIEGKRP